MQIVCKSKRTPNADGLKSFTSLWEHTGSNRGPSACKADALNQLSYAPLFLGVQIYAGNRNF